MKGHQSIEIKAPVRAVKVTTQANRKTNINVFLFLTFFQPDLKTPAESDNYKSMWIGTDCIKIEFVAKHHKEGENRTSYIGATSVQINLMVIQIRWLQIKMLTVIPQATTKEITKKKKKSQGN